MTNHVQPLAASARRSRSRWLALWAGLALSFFAISASAQAPAADAGLDTLVGPIALYPDDLIAIILPASTSPLQIVQADRFLDKRKADPKLPLDDNWDDPVKSLLNYPDIVKKMSADLDWTSALGEAVVTNQAAVLDAVQSFRRRAQAAGNLKSDDKQVVKAEKEIIIIQPANPEVIYVPQYNPSSVVVYGGAPYYYGYYPTPYPSYYYPYAPGAALAAGVIWGAAIGAAWSGNRYGYGGGDININRNTEINRNNTNINRGSGSGTAWKSNKQPGQVSSSVGKTGQAGRVGDSRGGAGGIGGAGGAGRPGGAGGVGSAGGVGGAGGAGGAGGVGSAGGARPSTQPAGGGGGYAGRDGGSGGGAFANSGASGRQTQADSSRGAASRSSASSMGGRSAPSGGGARGGGGGGRSGGGGRR